MDPKVKIRPETGADAETIFDLTQKAFKTQPRAAGTEGFIIDRLRTKGNLSLSLVAEKRGEILGQVSFSQVEISGQSRGWYGLGPVSVRPDLHGKGVGSALIRAGLERLAGGGRGGLRPGGGPRLLPPLRLCGHPRFGNGRRSSRSRAGAFLFRKHPLGAGRFRPGLFPIAPLR